MMHPMVAEEEAMTEQIIEQLTIRPATLADEWAVQQLFGALHAFNTTLDPRFALADGWQAILHEHLHQGTSHQLSLTLLAWAGREPVGLLMMDGHIDSPLFRHRQWAELLALYIDSSWRGSALAERLVAAGTAWARQHGYERIQLYVTRSNVAAQGFYARHGFRPVQEIWRLELGGGSRSLADSPDRAAGQAHGQHLLSIHQHGLLGDESEL